ncbi:methionine ABC transporter permease [Entomospira culicis]|uniref:ABC transporter permease n=1 Tax=Entomospira culicis TaxID=2719989 RepID=A0A968GF51_9SPIO|nr:methionine ABC transporter permease [Entomospira culicis]NIZ19149.1 ABC transporter permease [Entomospira culicis]NIZ69363.1 ABC transporter permease [Entomospira culicis]WDI37948.1 ABC transporter permease [Entomospira culicis]WDI38106.1 ABC transporter permease [Entomospira culicis]
MSANHWRILFQSLGETLLLIGIVGAFALVLGTILGIILFASQERSIAYHRPAFIFLNAIINTLRAIPFVILLIIMLPITAHIMGTILGYKAALPALIVAVVPFFARIVYLALDGVPKGVIEAMQAMGLARARMLWLLIQEARSAIIAGFTITLVTLVGFIAAATVIGTGGLGATAYNHGFLRNNLPLMYTATLLMILLVFALQFLGDMVVKFLKKKE